MLPVRDDHRPYAEKVALGISGLALRYHYLRHAANLPAVWADHDRLEQVFVNLLGNALGHNPPGTKVVVTADGVASNAVQVNIQ